MFMTISILNSSGHTAYRKVYFVRATLKTTMASRASSLNIIFIIIIIIYLQSFQKKPHFRWVFVKPNKMDCKDTMVTHLILPSEEEFQL